MQRFISEDPIGLAGGDTNLNAYVGNAPLDYTDPSGLKALVGGANRNPMPTSFRKDGCSQDGGLIESNAGFFDRATKPFFGGTAAARRALFGEDSECLADSPS